MWRKVSCNAGVTATNAGAKMLHLNATIRRYERKPEQGKSGALRALGLLVPGVPPQSTCSFQLSRTLEKGRTAQSNEGVQLEC